MMDWLLNHLFALGVIWILSNALFVVAWAPVRVPPRPAQRDNWDSRFYGEG